MKKNWNVIDLDSYRRPPKILDRLVEDDVLDVALVSFWHNSPYADLCDSPELRRRMRAAMVEVRDYLSSRPA